MIQNGMDDRGQYLLSLAADGSTCGRSGLQSIWVCRLWARKQLLVEFTFVVVVVDVAVTGAIRGRFWSVGLLKDDTSKYGDHVRGWGTGCGMIRNETLIRWKIRIDGWYRMIRDDGSQMRRARQTLHGLVRWLASNALWCLQ